MLFSPPSWFNFFQHPNTFKISIILSLIFWYLLGYGIDWWKYNKTKNSNF
jgi:hypothetical protein